MTIYFIDSSDDYMGQIAPTKNNKMEEGIHGLNDLFSLAGRAAIFTHLPCPR